MPPEAVVTVAALDESQFLVLVLVGAIIAFTCGVFVAARVGR